MLPNILKYEAIQKFIEALKEDILEYIGKDKACIIGLGENGVFYGEGVYFWLKKQGYNVTFTTMNDYGEGLEERKAKGRKILITDSHIIAGHAYRNALETLKKKKESIVKESFWY